MRGKLQGFIPQTWARAATVGPEGARIAEDISRGNHLLNLARVNIDRVDRQALAMLPTNEQLFFDTGAAQDRQIHISTHSQKQGPNPSSESSLIPNPIPLLHLIFYVPKLPLTSFPTFQLLFLSN